MQTDLEKRFPKSFKRILTSLNSVLANLSNTAFKRLIRNHTMHHIYIYIYDIYMWYIYTIYIYIYIYICDIYGVLGRTKHVPVDIYALNLFIEHSANISCSLLVNLSHTGESWKDETRACGYIRSEFIHWAGEHWWEQNTLCSFTTPQAFWQSSAPGALCTLGTSVVLYSLIQATLMSPGMDEGKDETRVCVYIYMYIYRHLKTRKWHPRIYLPRNRN